MDWFHIVVTSGFVFGTSIVTATWAISKVLSKLDRLKVDVKTFEEYKKQQENKHDFLENKVDSQHVFLENKVDAHREQQDLKYVALENKISDKIDKILTIVHDTKNKIAVNTTILEMIQHKNEKETV